MKKIILWILGVLAVGAGAFSFLKKRGNNLATQYEGMLLKTIPYNYRSSYIHQGKRFEILTGVGWSKLNSAVGGLERKTVELDIEKVESIPLGGYISDDGILTPL